MENNNSAQLNYVAVVGMSGRFPAARNVDEFWNNLVSGEQSSLTLSDQELRNAGVPEELIASPDFVKVAYMVDDVDQFDAGFFQFTPQEAKITDPQQRVLLECCYEAFEHAGYASEKYDGLVGVYVGTGPQSYYVRNLLPESELVNLVGPLRLSIGNEKSFASTMVSYKMDLKGPSVNVDTACSTSLVAIHQACQSLLSYECDIALSGGVSIDTPQKIGMHYKEGSIISPDGRCRPFDADAKGTVKGNGAGIVVLKRLAQAIEDGDTIYSVIKGSATNNDGSLKVGYTASSVEGQVEVISEAIARADVSVDSIRFVEAHGTGTILGDPIEVEALTQVYKEQTEEKGFCAIGSVKANVGHLDIAAGVAGLIKSSMALHHRIVPRTINFENPNPNIDFQNSPFFPNVDNLELDANGNDVHAGVSSFGIGGSNAHVVLGSSPRATSAAANRSEQLLLLSAKSQNSLDRQLIEVADYLQQRQSLQLADVAYTLQQGRNEYAYRAAIVATDCLDASQLLSGSKRKVISRQCQRDNPQICFIFPGQGAQHMGMAQDLYNKELAFKESLDECARLFQQTLDFDIRDYLYQNDDESKLNSTLVSQPLLFAVEYSLASLWKSIGVMPSAMIGHSVGEYVAACLSGVFSLEDATKLISVRARLMQSAAPGAMLMVHRSADEVAEYLSDTCSLAAINGPQISVLSAEMEHIKTLQKTFEEAGIDCRLLPTSHAFHSWMLEPILPEYLRELKNIQFNSPTIPYISNVTGDWIEMEQATDPNYWVKHLRGTVQFSKGLQTVIDRGDSVLLEVGPNQVLSTLARRSFDYDSVVPSARHARDKSNDVEKWLEAVGSLWAEGAKIDWPALHQHTQRLRVGLPTYQFDRKSHWVGRGDVLIGELEAANEPSASEENVKGREVPKTVADLLAKLWCDAFGLDAIGETDNFFELGGDSLLATQLISVIKQQLKVDVLLNELFDSENFGEFVQVVENKSENADLTGLDQGIESVSADLENRYERFPLTDIQQAYWIGRSSSIELGDVATHIYLEVDIRDGDVEKFQRGWNKLIQHHDMLRAIFLDSGEQQILKEVPSYEFDIIDLVGMDETQAESRRMDLRQTMSHQILPCDTWPLFDIKAITSSQPKLRLCISIDILIVDAWSMNMLIEQWLQLYRDSDHRLRPLEFSFRDYVIAEHNLRETDLYEKSEEYWFDRIDSLPAAPSIPIAKDPGEIKDVKFERRVYEMEADRWNVLKERAKGLGVTPTCLLINAFSEVLSLWCQSHQFTLNLTNYSRHPFHQDAEFIVGDFTSLTLLEICSSRDNSFAENAQAIQKQLWRDLDNRFVSAIHVLREMGKRRNGRVSMPVVFTSTLGGRALEHEQSADDLGEEVYGVSQTSQVWLDHQVMEWQGKLKFNWDVVEELFPAGMIQSMFDVYCQYIERLVDEAELWNSKQLNHLLPAADQQLVDDANHTHTEYEPVLLHEGFIAAARSQPENIAVYDADVSLTYQSLYAYSQVIGQQLRDQSIQPNEIVGIYIEKSWRQLAAVMGILSSGAAYLPIDTSLPEERINFIIEDSGIKCLIVSNDCSPGLPGTTAIDKFNIDDIQESQLNVARQAPPLQTVQALDDIAYVLYTSGSTGAPKGAMLSHRGPANTVRDMNRIVEISDTDRVIALSALHFDLSVYDVFGTLSSGAALVIVPPSAELEPATWDMLIKQHTISLWNSVPALVQIYVDYLDTQKDSQDVTRALRTVVMSGDWIPPKLPARMASLWSDIKVLGAGGPTECSIWDACHWVTEEDTDKDSIPYGYPMENHQIHILNAQMQTCPVGVSGEMYVAGEGLFKGYLGDQEKTDAVLLNHPETGQLLYKSGDLGRYTGSEDDGLEILGRADFQIKINGYRIELGEIEAAIREVSDCDDVVVIAQNKQGESGKGANRLVAYMASDSVVDAQPKSDAKDAETQAKLVEFKLSKPGIRKSQPSEVVHLLPEISVDEQAYKVRKSYREYLGDDLTLARFSQMLGCLSELRSQDISMPKYRYASAGSLHPVQVFLHVKKDAIAGLEQGFYYYQPASHHLVHLQSDADLTSSYWGNGENPHIFDRAAFSLFLVGEYDAIEPVYGAEDARGMMYLEAGYMSQLLQEVAPTEEIGLCPIGYIDDQARELLGLSSSQSILHCIVGGAISQEQIQSWTGSVSSSQQESNFAVGASGQQEMIKEALARRLPSYMLPSSFVSIEQLPLTSNGKVDRKLLASMEVRDTSEQPKVAPTNQLETDILKIWQEILGLENIGTQDNFFEIGGDSVLILQVFQRLCDDFSFETSVVDLFKYPKIQELAAYLADAEIVEKSESSVSIEKVNKQKAAIRRRQKIANRGAN